MINQLETRDILKLEIIKKYKDINKVTQIEKELNISTGTIQKQIDKIYIKARKLPKVLVV